MNSKTPASLRWSSDIRDVLCKLRTALPTPAGCPHPTSTALCPAATRMHPGCTRSVWGGCRAAANPHYSRDQLCNLLTGCLHGLVIKTLLSNNIEEADLPRGREWMEWPLEVPSSPALLRLQKFLRNPIGCVVIPLFELSESEGGCWQQRINHSAYVRVRPLACVSVPVHTCVCAVGYLISIYNSLCPSSKMEWWAEIWCKGHCAHLFYTFVISTQNAFFNNTVISIKCFRLEKILAKFSFYGRKNKT